MLYVPVDARDWPKGTEASGEGRTGTGAVRIAPRNADTLAAT